jgi:hypothetical protein
MKESGPNIYRTESPFRTFFNNLNPTQKAEVIAELKQLDLDSDAGAEQAKLILESKLGYTIRHRQHETRAAVKHTLDLFKDFDHLDGDPNPDTAFKNEVSDIIQGTVIDLDKARKMKGGGTHELVSTKLGHQATVIKFPKKPLTPAELKEKERLSRAVEKHFGSHATAEVQTPKLQVKDKKGGQRNTPAIIQMKVDKFGAKERDIVDVSAAHLEDHLPDTATYLRANSGLLTDGPFLAESFTQTDSKLQKLFRLMEKDQELRDLFRNDFLPRVQSFFKETGEFIDISGARNIIFYKENGQWTYKIGSVIKNENQSQLDRDLKMLENNFEAFATPQNIDRIGKMLDSLNCIRFFNACSLACGRAKIFDTKLTPKQIKNLDRIRQLKTGQIKLAA